MIYNEQSKGLTKDKPLDLTRSNGPEIHRSLCVREIHCRRIVNIPSEIDLFRRVLETSNLFSEHHKISLEVFQRDGHVMFQDAFTHVDDVTVPPSNATILDPANIPAHKDSFYENFRL